MTRTKFEFGSTLHRNRDEMLDAIAYEWMTGGGWDGPEAVTEGIAENPDPAYAAAECIRGWDLDQPPEQPSFYDDPEPSDMEFNDYTAEDLTEAMARFISERPDIEAAKAEEE